MRYLSSHSDHSPSYGVDHAPQAHRAGHARQGGAPVFAVRRFDRKAFRVLEAFDGSKRHMTLADIARAAALDRSATQRLVHTLEALGYLRRIPDTRNYGLSPKVLQLSYNYLRANELIDKASPYLLDISRSLGETTNLQELDGH